MTRPLRRFIARFRFQHLTLGLEERFETIDARSMAEARRIAKARVGTTPERRWLNEVYEDTPEQPPTAALLPEDLRA